MPSRNPVRLAVALATIAAALPAGSASAKLVEENYQVPSVGGAVINVDVVRDDAVEGPVPVILTYSPYNTLGLAPEGNVANDGTASTWVPRGYARAVADVIGTRNSTGCWDYGGPKEIQSGVDVVQFLAKQQWSNGRIGMMGASYDGTTANMVAATGIPELKAIVPIAAISRWYGYAYSTGGVRYFLNSERATDEGFDTPLLFDFGFGRTPHENPSRDPQTAAKVAQDRLNPCDSVRHTERAYDPQSPDYDAFWLERDYRKDADEFRAATLIAHGWQDYNVKQEEGVALFEQLPVDDPKTRHEAEGVPLKRLWMTQGRHSSPSGGAWNEMLRKFLDRYLKGEDTGVEDTPAVTSVGRRFAGGDPVTGATTTDSTWPPKKSREKELWVRRTFDQDLPVQLPNPGTGETGVLSEEPNDKPLDNIFTWVGGSTSEEFTNRDPLNEPGHGYYSLYFKSAELAEDTRIAGTPVLDGYFRAPAGAHVSPVLVDVAPDGTLRTFARGFLNLDYRDGLAKAKPANNQWVRGKVEFLPQDVTLAKGHRIGLMVMGANTVWAVPGTPGPANILTGPLNGVSNRGSVLRLPVVPAEKGGSSAKAAKRLEKARRR